MALVPPQCRPGPWIQVIWMADVVGFAETFLSAIDWARVRRLYPFVLSALSLYQCLGAIPDRVLDAAGVEVGTPPRGIGQDYRRWSAVRAGTWDSLTGRLRFVERTTQSATYYL